MIKIIIIILIKNMIVITTIIKIGIIVTIIIIMLINRGIFQEEFFHHFLCTIPLSLLLRRAKADYDWRGGNIKKLLAVHGWFKFA